MKEYLANSSTNSFDYSLLDSNTADFLKDKAVKINQVVKYTAYEIGEQLKEAKERLSKNGYGIFEDWYRSLGFKKTEAYQYINHYEFVRSESEQSKIEMFENAPKSLQVEMSKPSAIPKANEAVFNGDIKTHKEYKALEKQLKQEQLEREKQAELIKALENREPQKVVIEKRVEVAPDDYEQLKRENQSLKLENSTLQEKERIAREGAEYAERERNRILKEREAVNKKSEEYDQLTKDIESLERSKSRALKQITAIKDFRKFEEDINELLAKLSPLIYQEDLSALDANGIDRHQYEMLVHKVEDWCHDMHQKLNRLEIKEAEIVE